MILGFLKGYLYEGKRKETNFVSKINKGIKLHTIRWDSTGRWKPGMKIHFATGVRTSKYHNFKMGMCSGVQKIHIYDRTIIIDGRKLALDEVEYLAHNDGFDDVNEFWGWFDMYTPFTGKIIHWTELRYVN